MQLRKISLGFVVAVTVALPLGCERGISPEVDREVARITEKCGLLENDKVRDGAAMDELVLLAGRIRRTMTWDDALPLIDSGERLWYRIRRGVEEGDRLAIDVRRFKTSDAERYVTFWFYGLGDGPYRLTAIEEGYHYLWILDPECRARFR